MSQKQTYRIDCGCCGTENTLKFAVTYRWLFGGKRTQPGDITCGLCGAVLIPTPVKAAQPA